MSFIEEAEVDHDDNHANDYENDDKLNYVVLQLRKYAEDHYLPFFRTSNTFDLFDQLLNL